VTSRRGPDLPYSVVAGVTPCGSRWLVASAKIHGSTFAPEPPRLYDSFIDVLSERPAFIAIVVNSPIGYVDGVGPEQGGRLCDHEARALLGRRGATIHNAPSRDVLRGETAWNDAGLDAVSATMLPRFREVALEMSPYRQRVVYEGNPELSFYQLRTDTPLTRSKRIEEGREERREILMLKMPGIDKVLDAELDSVPVKHLLDAAALLWTARRIFARAARRLPKDPQWDSEGLRMEIVY
jgi:predicted RNase H-like nuclease